MNAFHDAASLALDSLNHNLFLELTRRDNGTFDLIVDTIKDHNKLAEVLQSAALFEAGELGFDPTMLESPSRNPRWRINTAARLLLALSRLQLVIVELDEALSTIEETSSNFLAVYHLISAHFLPDYSNLTRAIERVTDAIEEGLVELFELRTEKQTGGAVSGQFSAITLPITVSLLDQDYPDALPGSAFRGVSRASLRAFGHEAPKVEGEYIIAQLSRRSAACNRFLDRLSSNERKARPLVVSAVESNFQDHLRSRLAFL